MKSMAVELASKLSNPAGKLNVVREYVQACILRSIHESEAFESLSFVGGTALRFLYDLPRFSEDLDFSVEEGAAYQPENWFKKLKRDLTYQGFEPKVTLRTKSNVHVVWVRIPQLLQQIGLSVLPGQNLSVKIEMDTKPPAGARTESKVLNRPFLFVIRHHSLPSLFAGKIHALLTRSYNKGRDWYDLLWYLTKEKNLEPEMTLLKNALVQTGQNSISAEHWKQSLLALASVRDWKIIRQDVEPFLERHEELNMLNYNVFENLLNH